MFKKHKQIIMYLIFGTATAAINWIVYTLLSLEDIEMTISNTVAWIAAVIFAFITNKLFVFESRSFESEIVLKEVFSFLSSRVFTGLFEIIFPTILFNLGLTWSPFEIDGLGAKLVITFFVVLMNYILSKRAVFKKILEENKNDKSCTISSGGRFL